MLREARNECKLWKITSGKKQLKALIECFTKTFFDVNIFLFLVQAKLEEKIIRGSNKKK